MSLTTWVNKHYEEKGPVAWLAFSLELIAASVLFFLMLLTCVDVAGRYLLNNSLDGATELTEIGLAIMLFAEMPVVTWRGGHVVVDILDRVLGSGLVKILGLLAALVISTSMYFLAVRIFELGERSIRRGAVTEYLGLPSGYIVEYIAVMSWVVAVTMITYGIYRTVTDSAKFNH